MVDGTGLQRAQATRRGSRRRRRSHGGEPSGRRVGLAAATSPRCGRLIGLAARVVAEHPRPSTPQRDVPLHELKDDSMGPSPRVPRGEPHRMAVRRPPPPKASPASAPCRRPIPRQNHRADHRSGAAAPARRPRGRPRLLAVKPATAPAGPLDQHVNGTRSTASYAAPSKGVQRRPPSKLASRASGPTAMSVPYATSPVPPGAIAGQVAAQGPRRPTVACEARGVDAVVGCGEVAADDHALAGDRKASENTPPAATAGIGAAATVQLSRPSRGGRRAMAPPPLPNRASRPPSVTRQVPLAATRALPRPPAASPR